MVHEYVLKYTDHMDALAGRIIRIFYQFWIKQVLFEALFVNFAELLDI